jgi:two-component system KDP operon response regulator KdpE
MTGSGRRLFAKSSERAPERSATEKSVSLAEMIESGDFKIDRAKRTVTLRGEELRLSSEEFDVLVFLAGHPQRLVTPGTMLTTSWTANRLRRSEFLRALISLRKKLEAASPGKRYLRTEPWVMYRFDPTSSYAA